MTTQRWKHIRQMKERRMDGWMDGWLDEWVGGWTDGWKHAERLELTIEPMSKWLHTATQAKQVAATIRKKQENITMRRGFNKKVNVFRSSHDNEFGFYWNDRKRGSLKGRTQPPADETPNWRNTQKRPEKKQRIWQIMSQGLGFHQKARGK